MNNMSGMQGISGAGSMSRSCSMKSMHGSSVVKPQEGMQTDTEKQKNINIQDKIPDQVLGSKMDVKI